MKEHLIKCLRLNESDLLLTGKTLKMYSIFLGLDRNANFNDDSRMARCGMPSRASLERSLDARFKKNST